MSIGMAFTLLIKTLGFHSDCAGISEAFFGSGVVEEVVNKVDQCDLKVTLENSCLSIQQSILIARPCNGPIRTVAHHSLNTLRIERLLGFVDDMAHEQQIWH